MSEARIRQLPDHLANQIAAGEVIERPSAVVKELVENSIDAGAERIVVRIEEGGQRLVEVIDDGQGMTRAELPLALGRHATSKLIAAEDLFRIGTLGFRGEALPSIAAVSECDLASRPPGQAEGYQIAVRGGVVQEAVPAAMATGSRISVRNLFWNVPVRLKFLKTTATETGHVSDMVTRLALGHPHIGFLLEINGKTALDLPPVEDLLPRIRACLGRQTAEGLIAISGTGERLQVGGLVAHPSQARPTGKRQFVWLNGRHIRDRLLVAAVREGYRGFCEPRLHPVVFLHIDCAPELVDVNVHPTKSEVRFRRDKEVFHLVRGAIRAGLEERIGGFSLLGGESQGKGRASDDVVDRRVIKSAEAPSPPPPPPGIQERYLPQTPMARGGAAESASQLNPGTSPAPADRSAEAATAYSAADRDDAGVGRPAPVAEPPAHHLPQVRQVVQLNDMYVLAETEQGIRLIDQHALHEKALWLSLDPQYTDLIGGGRQELLVPKTVELSAAEVQMVEGRLAELAEQGIEAEVFGPTSLAVRAYPSILNRVNWTAFFSELASQGPGTDALERLRTAIGHRRACRQAIKAGHRLNEDEMLHLVELLQTIDGLEHCPHGRPTTLDLSWDELERRFQR